MKKIVLCFLLFVVFSTGCERKLSTAEVKEKLEKAMTDHIRAEEAPGQQRKFDMLDVSWYEDTENYYCTFTVKLKRPDGTDTTGHISGIISKDFSNVKRGRI